MNQERSDILNERLSAITTLFRYNKEKAFYYLTEIIKEILNEQVKTCNSKKSPKAS